MIQLTTTLNPKLNDNVLSNLKRQKISTVLEFLRETPQKLVQYSNLHHKDVLDIKEDFIKSFGGEHVKASTLISYHQKFVKTKISCLDVLMKGGLYSGQIYELCGGANSGKTQLCLSITATMASENNMSVYYIDTKRDFHSSRLRQILNSRKYDPQTMNKILEKVKVWYIYNIQQLFKVLELLTTILGQRKQEISIIIIDSLPAIIFKLYNDQSTTVILNRFSNLCKFIANELNSSIIIVNVITQWTNNTNNAIDEFIEIKPLLGNYWLHIPNTRFMIDKIADSKMRITVWKSYDLITGNSCTVNLNDAGVN